MKGKLIKTSRGWEIEYEEKVPQLHFLAKQTVAIPLHPDDAKEFDLLTDSKGNCAHHLQEGQGVEFEIVNDYEEPKGDIQYAKLTSPKQEESSNWDEIFEKHWEECEHNHMTNFQDWLTQNYNPPVKR